MRNLVFTILLLLYFNISFASNECDAHNCLILVDAGSSGSRAHLFKYTHEAHHSIPHVEEIWSKKITPGFATLEASPHVVDPYLNRLFHDIPKANLPVYFFATAGMRVLSQHKQGQLSVLLHEWFNKHSDRHLVMYKTLSGSEEGLYSWVSVNYQLDRLATRQKPLVGVLDMGGASVQIAFPVDKATPILSEDEREIEIGKHHYRIFVHSFLGLGKNLFMQQFLDNPECFPVNYLLPSGQLGIGDVMACKEVASTLINGVQNVHYRVQPVLGHVKVEDWFVIGGMTLMLDVNPSESLGQFNNLELLTRGEARFCQKSWEEIEASEKPDDLLYGYCLFSAYTYALMVNGYGLQPQTPLRYFVNDTDWSKGAALILAASS